MQASRMVGSYMPNGGGSAVTPQNIGAIVNEELESTHVIDVHTHLYMPSLSRLSLSGIDALLTYHYLEAEFFRVSELPTEKYWKLSQRERADAIWSSLFVENPPVSEAARHIITILKAFGLPTGPNGLREARVFFASQDPLRHLDAVLKMARVDRIVMTNDPLDAEEASLWTRGLTTDDRFHSALRLDRMLNQWSEHWQQIAAQGYDVQWDAGGRTVPELRRFFADWHARMAPVYLAVSLPEKFRYPDNTTCAKLLADAVLPACQEFRIPIAMMIGVRRQVNPALRLAGDGSGRANLVALERVCLEFPDNRFLVSVLSRENQHELCVYARKFNNLLPFGCWWFLNQPSIVAEITTERLEMLGSTFIPQHSDARVLEQLIPKWRETRRSLAPILTSALGRVLEEGRELARAEVAACIHKLLRSNFERFCGISPASKPAAELSA